MDKNKKNGNHELIKGLSMLSQIGVSMASCVLVGVFIGKFLDGFLGTTPWLLLVFSLFGTLAAFKALFDLTMKK